MANSKSYKDNKKEFKKPMQKSLNNQPKTEVYEHDNIIIGRNAVHELIKSGKTIDKIFVLNGEREGSITQIVAKAINSNITVIEVDKRKLDQYGEKHQGVAALIPEREYAEVSDILKLAEEKNQPPFIVILDHIQDPHNLGAVIRSAECAGAHGVIIPKRNAATLNFTAVKAAAGAAEHLLIARVNNIVLTIEELKKKNIWIYATDMKGQNIYESDLKGAAAFVIGNEGDGVSRLALERSDFIISIPMFGKINSLNASAAAAITLFEAAKQRNL